MKRNLGFVTRHSATPERRPAISIYRSGRSLRGALGGTIRFTARHDSCGCHAHASASQAAELPECRCFARKTRGERSRNGIRARSARLRGGTMSMSSISARNSRICLRSRCLRALRASRDNGTRILRARILPRPKRSRWKFRSADLILDQWKQTVQTRPAPK